jgi:protein arginine kinase activator
MFCQNCGSNQANVHINTPAGTLNYCQVCALEKLHQNTGDSKQTHKTLNSACTSVNSCNTGMETAPPIIAIIPAIQVQAVQSTVPDVSCRKCKCSFSEFILQGRFSCPDCYEAFALQIKQHQAQLGQSGRYCGKHPARAFRHLKMLKQIQELRQQLNEEVKRENYDNAVKLRDTIKDLEKEIEQSIKSTSMDKRTGS